METIITPLKAQWLAYQQQHPKVRIRDAAKALNVTEARIIAACTGGLVRHMKADFPALLHKLPALGRIMVLTRNESCVIERKGAFENINTESKHVALAVGKDIDLRMFINRWAMAFALENDTTTGFKTSIQIFDSAGDAIMKIYAQPETDMQQWNGLVQEFTAAAQPDTIQVTARVPQQRGMTGNVDREAFLSDWAILKDTHDFYPMLMKYRIDRLHALELAEGRFSRRISSGSVKTILQNAASGGLEIMVFVGNHGNIEIHTGPVHRVLEIPEWINVMDADFNLHVKTTDIAFCWVVDKPAEGGVTSVEVFDKAGEMIIQFFGKRKPGIPELPEWRALLAQL
jgi:putative hemin transport protein